MAAVCAPLADGFIRCMDSVQPDGSDGGNEAFAACAPEQLALASCYVAAGVSGQPAPVPADVCPGIPRPPAVLASCSAGESVGGTSGENCTSSCQDNAGNVWAAKCLGSTCTCTYNGGRACTCTMTDPDVGCNSCCP